MAFGRKNPSKELEEAQKKLDGLKQNQKDLSELRGMPGHKEALKTSASAIHKAQKAVTKLQKQQER